MLFFILFLRLAHVFFRIAAVPGYPRLRRFKTGCNFKHWTGDNSKALMKVDDHMQHPFLHLANYSYRSFCPQSLAMFPMTWSGASPPSWISVILPDAQLTQ
jgi:hypothetical protein